MLWRRFDGICFYYLFMLNGKYEAVKIFDIYFVFSFAWHSSTLLWFWAISQTSYFWLIFWFYYYRVTYLHYFQVSLVEILGTIASIVRVLFWNRNGAKKVAPGRYCYQPSRPLKKGNASAGARSWIKFKLKIKCITNIHFFPFLLFQQHAAEDPGGLPNPIATSAECDLISAYVNSSYRSIGKNEKDSKVIGFSLNTTKSDAFSFTRLKKILLDSLDIWILCVLLQIIYHGTRLMSKSNRRYAWKFKNIPKLVFDDELWVKFVLKLSLTYFNNQHCILISGH